MKKFIHISTDEKFINSAYWQFSKCFPEQNLFFILLDNVNENPTFVNLNSDFIPVEKDPEVLVSILKNIDGGEIFIFHGLSYSVSLVANILPAKYIKIWVLFGKEIYSNPLMFKQSQLYGPRTYKKFVKKSENESFVISIRKFAGKYYRRILGQVRGKNEVIKEAIQSMDYCALPYQEEFQLIQRITRTDLKNIKFSYYPIEKMLKDSSARVKSNNILIGNSASFTNNHLEVFEILKTLPLKNQEIIAPLSYGNEDYGTQIAKIGNDFFGNKFFPLKEFLPLHEYNQHISRCGIVIMNHYRQQAVGNVFTLIWMGAKVFLNEKNTLYTYLKRIGIVVFSISQDLIPQNLSCLEVLPLVDQNKNREILTMEISQDVLLKNLKNQIEQISL